ncbi:MAG: phosphotransferase [Candidatus Nealsonbacteria bacterium]|nr:phosphotransferase [Candidatus Nealsonbacteria bacterium]
MFCDFHIHTNFSDGVLPLREVIDLFGRNRFDAISITDHILDKKTFANRRDNNCSIEAITEKDFPDYLKALQKEKKRAWQKYKMLVIPGVEITNDWGKYHILAIDIKKYIDPCLPVENAIKQIHNQGGIAIACHPHHKTSEGKEGKQLSARLWDEHKKYVNLFDAWEVANRDDLFNVIGLKKFNYIANSDFHQPWHLYSWKTLLKSAKNVEAIKTTISQNKKVAIYLYRR